MIGNYCINQFWDINKTWNNEVPDFTDCFQDTIFVSAPSIAFSICFIIHMWMLPKPLSHGPLPWTWLNISKTVLSFSLLILSIACFNITIYGKYSDVSTPHSVLLASCTKVVLFISVSLTMLKHRICGVTTSYLLSVFWLVFTLCAIVLHRSTILNYFIKNLQPTSESIFIIHMVFYPLIYAQLILSVFPDRRNYDSFQENKVLDDVSFLSLITYGWFNRYIYMSTKKFLTFCDLGYISFKLTTKYVYAAFNRHWKFHLFPEELKSRSLLWALIKSFWPWVIFALLMDFVFIFFTLLPPLLLDRIIDFVHNDYYPWRGYFYATIMFTVDFVGKIIQNNAIYLFLCVGSQMKSSLMNAIFRKNLLLSTVSRKNLSSGNISSLMSVDVERVYFFCWNLSQVIAAPITTFLIIVIMWQYIGSSALAGVAVIVLLFPFSFYISRVSGNYYEKHMLVKDTRLKYMNEVLSGIKILKLYAWEIPFSKKISQTRKEELKLIFYTQFCYTLTEFVFSCAPIMVSIASFATFLLVDRNNILDPTKAFVSLTLMEQLRYSMFELPDAVSELMQCNIALGRLKEFLIAENTDVTIVGDNPDAGEVVSIKEASFTWEVDTDYALKNINLHIPKGKLVAVIGPVGCGKSSLLSTILGELYKIEGSIDVKGSIAYVPQQAWILNRTVRDNVLLVKHMVEEKYNKILDLCCLRPDLEILPAGDQTEIGEKGVNLSGGQKQRVSLARAVYQDKDIYLLDDTLSAVDSHVRKSLFDDIIGSTGLLKNKTRILVTHDVSMLHKVDLIVIMKNGQIEEIGTYQELMNDNESFTNFIQEHTSERNLEENYEENKKFLSRYISIDSMASKISDGSATGDQGTVPKFSLKDGDQTYRLTEDEKMEIGSVNKLIYWNYIKTVGCFLSILTIFGYMSYVVLETVGNIWLSKWSSDVHVNGTQNVSTTTWRLTVYGAIGLSQATCVMIGNGALVYGTIVAARKYHNKMLDCVMRSPMSFFDSTPTGRIINRNFEGGDLMAWAGFCLRGKLPLQFPTKKTWPIENIKKFCKLHLTTLWQIKRLESISKSPIFSQLLECIQGVSSICAFKVQGEFIESFEEKLQRLIVCDLSVEACNRWLNFYLDCVGSSIVLISSIIVVYYRDTLTAADVGLMITYTITVTDAIKWFVRMCTELENRSISVERVAEYSALKPEAAWRLPQENLSIEWPLDGNILFDNYSTKYRDDLDLVLKEVNLSINGGDKVGIVGRTGAGKSSITMALFRIIEPVSGTIFIDDVDIAKIGLHSLRSKLTIIPQDPVLFTGSLRTNLDPNDEYCDEKLWESLERAHLKEFVSNLDEGLEYEVEEEGGNLSAGQKQLVCLARALLKNTKILILDEATASVDMETDSLIQNTIRTAFSKQTVLTIAHRINTVLDYDKIVVMENGTVIEVGSPTSLLQDSESKFYQMAQDSGLI